MSVIIDRRLNPKNRSAVNRARFINRYKAQLQRAVGEAISNRSVADSQSGETVHIPTRDISEPAFSLGTSGTHERVFPGNKSFNAGDEIERPPGQDGQGGGSNASNEGEGLDEFSFTLSRDEFMDLLFEDLALPDLVKKELKRIEEFKFVRSGFTSDGVPTNINVVRSLRGAMARRIALGGSRSRRLRKIEATLAEPPDDDASEDWRLMLEDEADTLRTRLRKIPWLDTFDLRYNNRVPVPVPVTQAVMVCVMDVSGSMDQHRKDLAKRLFTLLHLFLERNYKDIDVVFVRHHTSAREVDEDEFFHARETGGTVVSSALDLTADILRTRYPADRWNAYVAQASDGDNWGDDSLRCHRLVQQTLMPMVQYFAYVEVAPDQHQNLWHEYTRLADEFQNFSMATINEPAEVFPVLRKLFEKER